jgi:hypothetical protein
MFLVVIIFISLIFFEFNNDDITIFFFISEGFTLMGLFLED